MKVSKILAKDREIREAKFGYIFVATIFTLWFVLRVPGQLVILTGGSNLIISILSTLVTICILGVCILAFKRNSELSKLRDKLSKEPERYVSTKISGPPILNTIIPFILK